VRTRTAFSLTPRGQSRSDWRQSPRATTANRYLWQRRATFFRRRSRFASPQPPPATATPSAGRSGGEPASLSSSRSRQRLTPNQFRTDSGSRNNTGTDRITAKTEKSAVEVRYRQNAVARNRASVGWAWADLNHENLASLGLWAQTTMAHALLVAVLLAGMGPGGFEPPHTRCPRHRVASIPYEPGALTGLSYGPAPTTPLLDVTVSLSSTGAIINSRNGSHFHSA
jgi:hypothetical protein